MEIKNVLRTSVAAGALLALAPVAISSSADAGSIKQQGKMDLTVGGQIARGLAYVDDGENSQLFHIDNPTTGTRVRFIAKGQMTESISVGGLLEYDVGQSNENIHFTTSTNSEAQADTTTFGIRHADISFSHKSLGKLSIGQGNGAANGTSESSYAGISSANAGGGARHGRLNFYNDGTNAYSGQLVSNQLNHFDGLSRNDRIRYDSPSFAGLKIAASLKDGGAVETAARYGASFGGVKVKLAGHWLNNEAEGGGQQYSISGAAMHSSGLNVEGGYGGDRVENSGLKGKWWKAGVGYSAKLSSLGATNFAFIYHETEDQAVAGNEGSSIWLGAVQKIDSIGMDIGLNWERYSLDDTAGTDYADINIVYFVTKLNF